MHKTIENTMHLTEPQHDIMIGILHFVTLSFIKIAQTMLLQTTWKRSKHAPLLTKFEEIFFEALFLKLIGPPILRTLTHHQKPQCNILGKPDTRNTCQLKLRHC